MRRAGQRQRMASTQQQDQYLLLYVNDSGNTASVTAHKMTYSCMFLWKISQKGYRKSNSPAKTFPSGEGLSCCYLSSASAVTLCQDRGKGFTL